MSKTDAQTIWVQLGRGQCLELIHWLRQPLREVQMDREQRPGRWRQRLLANLSEIARARGDEERLEVLAAEHHLRFMHHRNIIYH